MAIVFVHRGYSPYMEFTLRQARAADPEAEVLLLGDPENDRFAFVTHVDTTAAPYASAAAELGAAYRHLSTNRVAFERFCFERWFVLQAAMRARGLDRALVLDTDVLLYATEAEVVASHVGERPVGIGIPEVQEPFVWVGAPHASYWTRGAVDAFCAFVLDAYRHGDAFDRKWAYHRENAIAGGVCDMTALYLFARSLDPEGLANPISIRDGAVFDHNLNVADNEHPLEFEMEGRYKWVGWRDGRPVGRTRSGELVRWLGLHLQGQAKARVPGLYRGPAFPGQRRLSWQLALHFAARRLASQARTRLKRVRPAA